MIASPTQVRCEVMETPRAFGRPLQHVNANIRSAADASGRSFERHGRCDAV